MRFIVLSAAVTAAALWIFHTAWDATSTLSLGPGVTVKSLTVRSPTEIDARVTVDPGAAIGFRAADVTTADPGNDSLDRALFVVTHQILGAPNAMDLAALTMLGVVTGAFVVGTGRIWPAVAVHVVFNASGVALVAIGTLLA